MIKLSLKVKIVLRIETFLMKLLVRITNYAREQIKKEVIAQQSKKLAEAVDNKIYEELMKHDR